MLNPFIHWIEAKGAFAPWWFVALFVAASLLMIWRLEAMSARGFEGTVLGTLVMPYCSGLGNLIFAFILGRTGGSALQEICAHHDCASRIADLAVPWSPTAVAVPS